MDELRVPCLRCGQATSSSDHLCWPCTSEYRHYVTRGKRCPCCGAWSVLFRLHESGTEAWEDCLRCAYTHDYDCSGEGNVPLADPPRFRVERDGPLIAVGDALSRALLLTDARAALALATLVLAGQAAESPDLRARGYTERLRVIPDDLGGVLVRRTDAHAHEEGAGPVTVDAELHLPDPAWRLAFARALLAQVPPGTRCEGPAQDALWSAR